MLQKLSISDEILNFKVVSQTNDWNFDFCNHPR